MSHPATDVKTLLDLRQKKKSGEQKFLPFSEGTLLSPGKAHRSLQLAPRCSSIPLYHSQTVFWPITKHVLCTVPLARFYCYFFNSTVLV